VDRNSGRTYLTNLSRKSELQPAFDFGHLCRLDLDAGTLGTFSVNCEREFTPLRWVVKSNEGAYLLSLSDDSGTTEPASISHYEFALPDRRVSIPYKEFLDDYRIPPSGGLYVASSSLGRCSIIFPHEIRGVVRTFADMGRTIIEPKFKSQRPNNEKLMEALTAFSLWAEARTTGSMVALLARQRVLRSYIEHIFGVIAGPSWAKAEHDYLSNPNSPGAALRLIQSVTEIAEIRERLERQHQTMSNTTPKERAEYLVRVLGRLIKRVPSTGSVGRYGILSKSSRWHSEFALRLASAPETLDYWTHGWFGAGVKALIDNQLLARAARFVVLTTSNHLQSSDRNRQNSLYAGWDWT